MSRSQHQNEGRWIVLFDSVHHVIAAEDAFKQRGVWCDLTPVPRYLSANCGVALEFHESELDAAMCLLRGLLARPHSIHRPGPTGHIDATGDLLDP